MPGKVNDLMRHKNNEISAPPLELEGLILLWNIGERKIGNKSKRKSPSILKQKVEWFSDGSFQVSASGTNILFFTVVTRLWIVRHSYHCCLTFMFSV